MNKYFVKALFFSLFLCSLLNAEPSLLIQNPAELNGNNVSTVQNENIVNTVPSKETHINKQKIKKTHHRDIHVLNNNNGVDTKNDPRLIAKLTVTKTKSSQILKIRKKMNVIQKVLSAQPNIVEKNRIIKVKSGQEVTVHIKAGYSTLVDFTDDAGNPVEFTYLTIGNNLIKVTQFGNKLEIKPLRIYSKTNLIVGIKGYDYPVTLNIEEVGDKTVFDNFLKIKLIGSFQQKIGSDDIKLKSAILQTIFKYGNIESLDKIDYEVYSLKTKKPVLFSKDVLKIYKVQKFGKTYYLVLINKNFKIYGNKSFGTYNSEYNIYFLNFNQNVFTIKTNDSLKMPYPMIERYRIVIKDF
jgi:hypothetical protein